VKKFVKIFFVLFGFFLFFSVPIIFYGDKFNFNAYSLIMILITIICSFIGACFISGYRNLEGDNIFLGYLPFKGYFFYRNHKSIYFKNEKEIELYLKKYVEEKKKCAI